MRLVRKYAYAFYNVYGDTLTKNDIEHYEEAIEFLRSRQRALFLLKIPTLREAIKWEGLTSLCKRFSLPSATHNLIRVLLKAQCSYVIGDILAQIVDIYKERRGIHDFVVSSSCELSDTMRSTIENFLAARVEGDIIYTYMIDKKLIAGVRLQSDTLLWECSLNKQLRTLNYSWIR